VFSGEFVRLSVRMRVLEVLVASVCVFGSA
jgi:hypothetical protein